MKPLRDYQEECLRTVVARYRAGVRKQLVVLPTGAGKCVARDTFLVTSSGLIRAEEAALLPEAVASHDGSARRPAAWIDDDARDTLTITTSIGTKITVTPRHPLLALDLSTGEPRWVQARQVRPGTLLVLQPPCPHVLPQDEVTLCGLTVTEELAWLMGAACSCGVLSDTESLVIRAQHGDMVDMVQRAARASGLQVTTTRADGYWLVHAGNPVARKALEGCGLALTGLGKAAIPGSVLRSPARVQAAFVRGVVAGNSTADDSISLMSRQLCAELQLVLLNLGCVTRTGRSGGKWVLAPETGADLNHLRWILSGNGASPPAGQPPAVPAAGPGVRVCRVVSVVPSFARVCDLHVPDTNSYIGNGLICHNTVVAAHLPARLGWPRTLFVVHREELIRQAVATFRSVWPTVSVGVERRDEVSSGDQVVVASIQSVCREPRLSRISQLGWGLVIIDEAHHAVASSYRRLLRQIGALEESWHGLLLGITATSRRGDGVGLWPVFEEVSYSRTVLEMVEAGYLVPMRGYLVRSEVSLAGVRIRHGDFDEHQLAARVNTQERNELVAAAYTSLAHGRRAAVFCVDVAHATALASHLRRRGVRCEAVYGAMPMEQRARVLESFRQGELDAVTNVGVLTEGYDDPGIDCIVMARPTCSGLLYTQIVGRGVRPAPGKSDCVVIDVLDTSRAHASSLVTLPTLFGLPPGFDLRGRAASDVVREYHAAARMLGEAGIPEELASQVLTPEDIKAMMVEVDLLRYAMVPPAVAAASDLVWQRMPDDSYVTPVGDATEVVVRQNVLGRWEVVSSGPGAEVHKHGECLSVTDAIRLGTRVVKDLYPNSLPLLHKGARWRQEPATEKQLALLRRLGVNTPPGLTRGQASLLITRHSRR